VFGGKRSAGVGVASRRNSYLDVREARSQGSDDFVDCGDPCADEMHSSVSEGLHSIDDRLMVDVLSICPSSQQPTNLWGDV
jgi:hypothetical protein